MRKKITALFILGTLSLTAQLHSNEMAKFANLNQAQAEEVSASGQSYLFESYSININPLTFIKGYIPLTLEMRIKQKLSIETGPALVTRPYLYFIPDARPALDPYLEGDDGINFTYLGYGEASYHYNLGWESSVKFYFDRDIWESSYFSLFHSYRKTTADLINFDTNIPDRIDHGFYTRNHFGFKFGRRRFLDELFSGASDKIVMDAHLGLSYAVIDSENFINANGPSQELSFLGNYFLHYGISIGFLQE